MSKKIIRKDKTCLNCRHVVENKFCPNCGQENSDTRKTFQHLFVHFFEDLTHYENAFWKTIKNLIFKPANLTKEYLSGKRLSYLAPVRLYIFISFLTFFIISIFPDKLLNLEKIKSENKKNKNEYYDYNSEKKNWENTDSILKKGSKEEVELQKILNSNLISKGTKDTLAKIIQDSKHKKLNKADFNFGFDTQKELDSARAAGKVNSTTYWFLKKTIQVRNNNTKEEIFEKAKESAYHNFPKVLLIYMPFFALFLWVFHSKKRWYYFDHGIFTLHYFSFLLLFYLIIFVATRLLELIGDYPIILFINNTIKLVGFIWMFYYFFPAHHRFYGETRWMSFIKSYFLFFINMFFISILLILFFLYTLINIH